VDAYFKKYGHELGSDRDQWLSNLGLEKRDIK
jgi:hypothetical protein